MIAFLAGVAAMGGFFYCAMENWGYATACFILSIALILLSLIREPRRRRMYYDDGYSAGAAVRVPSGGFTPRTAVTQIDEFRKAYVRQLSDVESQLSDAPRVQRDGFRIHDPDDLLGLDAIEEGQYH